MNLALNYIYNDSYIKIFEGNWNKLAKLFFKKYDK
jgi:hypothetical protein